MVKYHQHMINCHKKIYEKEVMRNSRAEQEDHQNYDSSHCSESSQRNEINEESKNSYDPVIARDKDQYI